VAWRIDFTRNADKAMRKLDKGVAARVFDELDEIAKLEDPRSRGKALTGNLSGVWRYRVGDYRILCDINDGRLVILVVDVAHRPRGLQAQIKKKSPSKLGGSRGIRDKEIIAWRQTLARRR
jgi:mRNA interferase RelE/StbE